MNPPKDIAELDALLFQLQWEWIRDTAAGYFGAYLRRRLAEHGVQMVRYNIVRYPTPYYTEPSKP